MWLRYLTREAPKLHSTKPTSMDAYRLYSYSQPKTPQPTTMSTLTIADLGHISREDLSAQLSSGSMPASLAIIDVRDSDHIGGHIKGSTHVPSSQLDYRIPELVRTLKDKNVVVFHCALSQQRGPSAALRYMRERSRLLDLGEKVMGESTGDVAREKEKDQRQKVVVLDGGFVQWQEK